MGNDKYFLMRLQIVINETVMISFIISSVQGFLQKEINRVVHIFLPLIIISNKRINVQHSVEGIRSELKTKVG